MDACVHTYVLSNINTRDPMYSYLDVYLQLCIHTQHTMWIHIQAYIHPFIHTYRHVHAFVPAQIPYVPAYKIQ